MKRYSFFVILVCMTILLTSCWDSINLEDRGFIVGTGISLENMNEGNEKQPEFKVTNQMVIPGGVGITEGKGDESPFLNITSTGASIYRTDNKLAEKSSQVPFYEHMVLLIVSEDIARSKHLLAHLLDTYIRNVKMRRSIKVVVSKDDPKKILEFNSPEKKLPARYIGEMLERGGKYSGFIKPIVLGDIVEFHLSKKSYILPMIELNEEVKYNAGAVFHGEKNEMVGILNANELQGLALMESNATGKILDFPYKDEIFAFEVIRIKNKVKVDPTNIERIKVVINIELEGIIKESFSKEDFSKSKEVNSVQKAVSNKVKDLVESSIHKGQQELDADVFHVWRELKNKHYETWKKLENDWEKGENYFSNVTFDINVDTEIYSMGTSNKTD